MTDPGVNQNTCIIERSLKTLFTEGILRKRKINLTIFFNDGTVAIALCVGSLLSTQRGTFLRTLFCNEHRQEPFCLLL